MHLELTTDIRASAGTVFGWLATPERAREWMTSVSSTEILDRKPGMVGTTFRETVTDGGGSMEMHGVVTAFEPERSIAFHIESRVNTVDVGYLVEPFTDRVRLRVAATVRWALPIRIAAVFARGRIERQVRDQLAGELERLRLLCEDEPAPG